ncbi:MAG TPA: SDR family oxidoreductase [Baekduia sp.]|nr:SDR family oxidoreductase [Baekduia sp.]
MDLGITGRTAIICASSRGLGKACALALAAEGVDVVINGRTQVTLDAATEEIRAAAGVAVTPVLGDVTTAEGRAALLDACPEPDILINNNAGPTPGPFLEKSHEDWLSALDGNMLAALALIRAVLPAMKARRFGRIINITSAMVTTPRPPMGISSGPRAGLTAVCKGLSIEVSPDNVTINNLLPERFDTDRQKFMAQRDVERLGIDYEQARANIIATIPAGRMGRPEEFGATCAFVCSAYAGYMTGMNIHLDGGAYPALV